jgi:acyl-CoA synthetase (AMP-forming)/AMP-acid ligase II
MALETTRYKNSPYLRWTYRNLKRAIDRLALGLKANGASNGMLMVTFLPNGAEYVLAKMAAHMMGCVFAPLNPRHLTSRDEVAYLLELFFLSVENKQAIVVVENSETAREVDWHGILDGAIKLVVSAPTDKSTDWQQFQDVMMNDTDLAVSPSPDRTAGAFVYPTDDMILCTSGTTSRPKACRWTSVQTAYTFHSIASDKNQHFGDGSRSNSTVILSTAPNDHVVGTEALSCALTFGGTIVFPGRGFDVQEFGTALTAAEDVTHTFLVPTMAIALTATTAGALGGAREHPTEMMRSVTLGGSRLSPNVLHLCTSELGAVGVNTVFGSTEGAFVRSGDRRPDEIIRGEDVAVGWVSRGQVLKICEPGVNSNI